MIVKIVYDELVSFLGDKESQLNFNNIPPISIMLVGLQGSGKTTTTAKLAKHIEVNIKKNLFGCHTRVMRGVMRKAIRKKSKKT